MVNYSCGWCGIWAPFLWVLLILNGRLAPNLGDAQIKSKGNVLKVARTVKPDCPRPIFVEKSVCFCPLNSVKGVSAEWTCM